MQLTSFGLPNILCFARPILLLCLPAMVVFPGVRFYFNDKHPLPFPLKSAVLPNPVALPRPHVFMVPFPAASNSTPPEIGQGRVVPSQHTVSRADRLASDVKFAQHSAAKNMVKRRGGTFRPNCSLGFCFVNAAGAGQENESIPTVEPAVSGVNQLVSGIRSLTTTLYLHNNDRDNESLHPYKLLILFTSLHLINSTRAVKRSGRSFLKYGERIDRLASGIRSPATPCHQFEWPR
jgi:hypothetical protein